MGGRALGFDWSAKRAFAQWRRKSFPKSSQATSNTQLPISISTSNTVKSKPQPWHQLLRERNVGIPSSRISYPIWHNFERSQAGHFSSFYGQRPQNVEIEHTATSTTPPTSLRFEKANANITALQKRRRLVLPRFFDSPRTHSAMKHRHSIRLLAMVKLGKMFYSEWDIMK